MWNQYLKKGIIFAKNGYENEETIKYQGHTTSIVKMIPCDMFLMP